METNDFIKDLEIDFATLLTDEDGNDELRNILDQAQDLSVTKKLVMEYCLDPEHENILEADVDRLMTDRKWTCGEMALSNLYDDYLTNKIFLNQFFQDVFDIQYEQNILDDFEIDEKGVLTKYRGSGGDVRIPDSVTSIDSWAFRGCSKLTSIEILDSVKSIGDYAFYECSSLTRATIGSSVTNIGNWAFESCNNLTSVTIGNSVTSIGDGIFWNCSSLPNIEIPNSVTSIGWGAFGYCNKLTSVIIEKNSNLTNIGKKIFEHCRKSKLILKTDNKYVKDYCEENEIKCEDL